MVRMPNSTEPQREGFGAYVRAKIFFSTECKQTAFRGSVLFAADAVRALGAGRLICLNAQRSGLCVSILR